MTKRDFFIVILRIIALFFLANTIFYVLPQQVMFLFFRFNIAWIVWIFFLLLLLFTLYWALVFKSDKIINFLGFNRGFDDDKIDFAHFSSLNIIKLAILFIGGFLFINNLPTFLINTYFAFKSSISQGAEQAVYNTNLIKYTHLQDYIGWGVSAFNLLVSYLMLKYFKSLSEFIDQKIGK